MTTSNKSSGDTSNNSSSGGQPQRTIQVKIGNQAAKAMTPDQAADYLKSIAASSSSIFGSSGVGGNGTFHREVKMTFENGSTSTVSLPRITTGNPGRKSSSSTTLTSAGFVATSGGSGNTKSLIPSRSSNINSASTSVGGTRADGMPCSEKEMKALMSMFVEIMGLQMNTERLNQVSTSLGSTSSSSNRKGTKAKQTIPVLESNPKKRSFSAVNTTPAALPAPAMTGGKTSTNTTATDTNASSSSSIQASNSAKVKGQQQQQVQIQKKQPSANSTNTQRQHGKPSLKITTTQKIGPNGDVITATMTTALPANSCGVGISKDSNSNSSLFQFPTDLPPPPGGWPEDLLWPDPKNAKNRKIIIRNSSGGDATNDLSDVDEDDDSDDCRHGKAGETVVVITTTTIGDSDDDADDYDDSDDDVEDDSDYDDNQDGNDDDEHYETESDAVSVDSLPGLEPIPDSERPVFCMLQQKQRQILQIKQKLLQAQQKRHEKLVLNGTRYTSSTIIDDDDDITIGEDDEVVTGTAGIVPFEWSALERAAMEDALEQEERIRKETNKKRNDSSNNSGSKGINRKGFRNSGGPHNNHHHYSGTSNDSNDNYNSMNFGDHGPQGHIMNAEYNSFQKKVDAANKKLGKAVQSWRNRVTTAAQSNDFAKLNTLLNGGAFPFNTATGTAAATNTNTSSVAGVDNNASPSARNNSKKSLKKSGSNAELDRNNKSSMPVSPEDAISEEDRLVQQQFLHPHLEIIVPHCVPKQIRQVAALRKGEASRELLTTFILNQVGGLYFMVQPVLKAGASNTSILFGRSAFDTACFYGDVSVVKLIVACLLRHFEADKKILMSASNTTASNSGTNSEAVVPTPSPTTNRSYHNFLHQTCQDSGWTPLHYAAISGSLEVVELLLRCEYASNYSTVATYKNKTYQLLPVLYIESNDTLTWRKQHTNTSGGGKTNGNVSTGQSSSGGGRSGGITARQLVEFVKNGTTKKEIESHGMALEEVIDYYHLASNNSKSKCIDNNANFETQAYLAMLNVIHERLLDCEMNGYHAWDDETVKSEIAKALEPIELTAAMASASVSVVENEADVTSTNDAQEPSQSPAMIVDLKDVTGMGGGNSTSAPISDAPTVVSSSASVATNNTNKQSGNSNTKNKKKKNKKGLSQQPPFNPPKNTNAATSQSGGTSTTANSEQSVSSSKDDPVVAALLGMGFDRDKIMEGVKVCGGLDRATADDVVAWIFGGNEASLPSTTAPSQSSPPSETHISSQRKGTNANKESQAGESRFTEKSSKPVINARKQSQEDEKVVAEQKLAAKREEQRRRNREWNNRAQARQILEDQEKIAKAAVEANVGRTQVPPIVSGVASNVSNVKGLISGLPPLAPSTGLLGLAPGPTPGTVAPISILKRSATVSSSVNSNDRGHKLEGMSRNKSVGQTTSHYAAAAAGLGSSSHQKGNIACSNNNYQSSAELENVYSNDTSSVASSSEFRCPPLMRSNIIEVSDNNDDATVSTIGSTPAIIVQQLPTGTASNSTSHIGLVSASFLAPPGFADTKDLSSGDIHSNNPYMIPPSQHPSTRQDDSGLSSVRPWDIGANDTYGISDLNYSAPAYVPASIYGARQNSSAIDRSINNNGSLHMGGSSSLGDGAFAVEGSRQRVTSSGRASRQNGIETGFISAAFGDSSGIDYLLAHNSRVDNIDAGGATESLVPGLNIESFGLRDAGNINSSLIESISTSALSWDDSANNRHKNAGSMLLGNVIGSRSRLDEQFDVFGNSTYDPLYQFSTALDASSSQGVGVSQPVDAIGISSLFQDHQGTLAAIGLVGDSNDPNTVPNGLNSWLGDDSGRKSDSGVPNSDSKIGILGADITSSTPSIW